MIKLFVPCFLLGLLCPKVGHTQINSEIILSYTLVNGANVGTNSTSMTPIIGGVNFTRKITKKKFMPCSVYAFAGIRYSRTGYGMEGYLDNHPEFYEKYSLSTWSDDTNSKLIQQFINVPVGIEFRFNSNPAKTPKYYIFSIAVLLNNAFLLSSNINESVYQWAWPDNISRHQSLNLLPYAKRYYPGLTIETKIIRFINMGLTVQHVSYKSAQGSLDFEDQSGSPYYEMISKNGVYRDISFYMGITVPMSVFKEKKKID
jgi:hypothetical protein